PRPSWSLGRGPAALWAAIAGLCVTIRLIAYASFNPSGSPRHGPAPEVAHARDHLSDVPAILRRGPAGLRASDRPLAARSPGGQHSAPGRADRRLSGPAGPSAEEDGDRRRCRPPRRGPPPVLEQRRGR